MAATTVGCRELYEDLREVAPRWQIFGIHLKVPKSKIDAINGGDGIVDDCFTRVLDAWLKGEGTCDVDTLVSALRMPGVDQRRLAKEIENNKSDVKLELPYLSAKLKACKPNWFLFGLGLGLKDADLKRIENQKQCRGVERCFSELLIYWLDGDDANINVLVNALKEVGLRVLAQKIQKKYEGRSFGGTEAESEVTNGSTAVEQTNVGQPMPSPQPTPQNKPQQAAAGVSDETLHKTLSMKNLFEITKYIEDINEEQLKKLGGALGLLYPTLNKMKDLLHDMVAAWLLRQDDVREKSGEPTFESLAKALEEIGHKGIACDVREQKHAKPK